jgi:ADP-heptose:LPS heptosyltransferase
MPSRLWDNSAETDQWRAFYGLHGDEKLVFVHAGTGGSSGSLPTGGFVDLLRTICESTSIRIRILLTYSGQEKSLASKLLDRLEAEGVPAELARPLDDLANFARSLVAADLFIAGSTGPIHLAGLHDIPTVGFYAGRRSRPDIRWQTLTQPAKRLSFTPPIGRRTGRNMALVDTRKAGIEVGKFLDELYS